jgi:hypothetical protein
MNYKLLIEQTKVESHALEHVTRALEIMLGWSVASDGFARKLSSVRFYTELYQRHMERLFALEEIDGYMENIAKLKPELASRVACLKQEHEMFRTALRETVLRLDMALPTHVADFDRTCVQLQSTIAGVLEHLHRERELHVEAIERDGGGEG